MKKLLLPLLLCSLISCTPSDKSFLSGYLNTGNLPQQSFTIDPEKDTTLTSNGGVRIYISKGTFATGQLVTIEWKEALDFASMLKAGLTTQSGKDLLRSGGMFYFDIKEKLTIQKPIDIAVPTEKMAGGMQLYKGDSSDGRLDWKAPKLIENVDIPNWAGKTLFQNNCASCHRVNKDLTGPSLSGITERRSKQWLYAVTRNTAAMSAFDPIVCCQKNKYGVVMQAFPGLSFAEMDSIYAYLNYETERSENKTAGLACDSCMVTDPTYDSLLAIYNQQYGSGWSLRDSLPEKPAVAMAENPADVITGKTYYQVTIQSEGWYNIDALLKEWTAAEPSNLIIYPQGERNEEMEYYLAIPAMKILVNGNVQDGGKTVVFYEPNGQIPLPQQRGAFIIAAGGTDGKYYFAKKDFLTSTSLIINLPVQKVSKENLEAQMKELTYRGLQTAIETRKNKSEVMSETTAVLRETTTLSAKADENSLMKIEKQLQKLTAQKMKDCGCNTPAPEAANKIDGTSDSIVYINY